MKTAIFMFFCFIMPLACWSGTPSAKTVTYEYDTGPLPPQYQSHSLTTIVIDDVNKGLLVTRVIEKGYATDKKETFKGDLGSEWYDELTKIVKTVPSCKQDRGHLIGGPTKTVKISGLEKDLQIRWMDICDKDKAWWNKWETFIGEASAAIEKMRTKKDESPIRYLKIDQGKIVTEISVSPDSVTRTARVYVSGRPASELSTEQVRRLRELVSAPNYYQAGEVKDPGAQKSGEFLDRGNGIYYSFEKGLADPVGRSDTRETLTRFFADLGGGVDLYKNVGKTVTIDGTVSNVMWQHMINFTKEYPHSIYLDIDKGQTVVYSKRPIECRGRIEVTGRVIKLEGNSKDPKRKEAADEYHIQAEKWTCRD